MKAFGIIEPVNEPARIAYQRIRDRIDLRDCVAGHGILTPEGFASGQFSVVGEFILTHDDRRPSDLPIQPGYLALDLTSGHLHAGQEAMTGPHLYTLLGLPQVARLPVDVASCLYIMAADLDRARALLKTVVPELVARTSLPAVDRSLPIFLTPSSLAKLALSFLRENGTAPDLDQRRFRSIIADIDITPTLTA
jgi:hypothetical protein